MNGALKRLGVMADQAHQIYHAEVAAGGEPSYPAWADDVKVLCSVRDIARNALVQAENFIVGFEDDELQEGIDDLLADIRNALQLAGAA